LRAAHSARFDAATGAFASERAHYDGIHESSVSPAQIISEANAAQRIRMYGTSKSPDI
jgi:hypothetical protein